VRGWAVACVLVGLAAVERDGWASPINHAGFDYYYGDLHAHTGLSRDGYSTDTGNVCPDGYPCGPYASVIEDARETWDLDFLSLTEHGNGIHAVWHAGDWDQQVVDLLAADDPEGGFVTVPGVELWFWDGSGDIRDHRNLYFFGDEHDLQDLRLLDVVGDSGDPPFTTDDCPEIFDLLGDLEGDLGPLLLIPHHPAIRPPGAADWMCADLAYNPVVENYSEHGNSTSPSYDGYFDPVDPNAERPDSTVDRALSPDHYGLRMGIISGTDSHDTRPGSVCDIDPRFADNAVNYGGGLTVVVMPEGEPLDRTAIYEALRDRRGQATSGPRLPVDFRVTVDGVDVARFGEEIEFEAGTEVTFAIQVSAADAAHVNGADLVRPEFSRTAMEELEVGRYTLSMVLDEGDTVVAYAIVHVDGGAWWADAGVVCDDSGESDLEQVWTSPIWVDVVTGGDDDDDTNAGDDDDSGGDDDTGVVIVDDDCSCDVAEATPRGWLVVVGMGVWWVARRCR